MNGVVKYLPYSLTLRAPAVVTTLSGEPNSAATQPFLPGTVLRGVLAGELLASGESPGSDDFRRLVLGGNVRFLHAYPAVGPARSWPVPIAWRKEKGRDGATVIDLAAYTGDIDSRTEFDAAEGDEISIEPPGIWPTRPLRRPEFPFVEITGSTARAVIVQTDSRSHQQRDRTKGRSTEHQGSLFVYESLEANQTFRGMIQVFGESDDDVTSRAARIQQLLGEGRPVLIGRSRRAGYGGAATIEFGPLQLHEVEGSDLQRDDVPDGALFRAYLLSACIPRDPCTGQLDPCAFCDVLAERLGGETTVTIERTFSDFEVVGGFNRKWQIEIPQAPALKAGSIFVLRARRVVSANALSEIMNQGIGERLIDGFGRIVFLSCHGDSLLVSVGAGDKNRQPVNEPLAPPPGLVRLVQERLLEAAVSQSLDREVRAVLGNINKSTKIPTGSLLGRLRIPLRNGNPAAALQTLRTWLDESGSNHRSALKEPAQKKLRDCRLGNGLTLRDWLARTADATAGTALAKHVTTQRRYHLGPDGSLASSAAEERGATYAVRLIDAVLAALARHARRRDTESKQ